MNALSVAARTPHSSRMQHPVSAGTCVAVPGVDMCPQLSCALTFMYLQQITVASTLPDMSPPSESGYGRRGAGSTELLRAGLPAGCSRSRATGQRARGSGKA
ncbi:RNA binding protein fox-1 homolog 1-like isoform X8 [Arapaima gigas]